VINLLRGLAALGIIVALLFGSAGRWDLPFFWAFVAVNTAWGVMGLFTVDPGLLEERWHPAVRNREFWFILLVGLPLFLAHLVIAGLDAGRFHWSDPMPPGVRIASLVLLATSWGLTTWAVVVNRFFSPVIRIQLERGHHLVTSGPYQYVRHPGYAGAVVGILSGPLVLGSWWAMAAALPIALMILWRVIAEDRFLHTELAGYVEYAHAVRYRLVPGIW